MEFKIMLPYLVIDYLFVHVVIPMSGNQHVTPPCLTVHIHEAYLRFNKGKREEITKERSHQLEFVYDTGDTKSFSSSLCRYL